MTSFIIIGNIKHPTTVVRVSDINITTHDQLRRVAQLLSAQTPYSARTLIILAEGMGVNAIISNIFFDQLFRRRTHNNTNKPPLFRLPTKNAHTLLQGGYYCRIMWPGLCVSYTIRTIVSFKSRQNSWCTMWRHRQSTVFKRIRHSSLREIKNGSSLSPYNCFI